MEELILAQVMKSGFGNMPDDEREGLIKQIEEFLTRFVKDSALVVYKDALGNNCLAIAGKSDVRFKKNPTVVNLTNIINKIKNK